MIGLFLQYVFQVSLLLMGLYIVYKWLLSDLSCYKLNRYVILSLYGISLLAIPFKDYIQKISSKEVSLASLNIEDIKLVQLIQGANENDTIVASIIGLVFIIGMVAMILYFLIVYVTMFRIIKQGTHIRKESIRLVIVNDEKISPFSWWNYVVMNKNDYSSAGDMIMAHEKEHINQRHWVDLLVAESMIVINWFNPAAWLMMKELKCVHEYDADAQVLKSGFNTREYQLLLIKKAVGSRFPSVANNLNHSKLKKRITMMLSKKQSKRTLLRYVAIVPTVALVLSVMNQPMVASVITKASNADILFVNMDKGSNNASEIKVSELVEVIAEGSTGNQSKECLGKNADKSRGTVINVSAKENGCKKPSTKANATKYKKQEVAAMQNIAENTKYYIDGIEVNKDDVEKFDASKIKAMNVDKANNAIIISTVHSSDKVVKENDNSQLNGRIKVVDKKNASTIKIVKGDSKTKSGNLEKETKYIVDGVEMSKSDMNKISPSSIKSIDVDKSGEGSIIKITTKD